MAAGGNLDHFTVAIGGTPTAGANLAVTLTAKDSFDRVVRNYVGTHCLVFSGPGNSPNPVTAPSYPAPGTTCLTGQSAVSFTNGAASPAPIKVFLAGANVLNVTDPAIPFSGSSASFTVKAGSAATLTFAAKPIDTKTGEPIYSVCVPDLIGTKPCAPTTQAQASVPVSVSQLDAWGNVSADQVTILGVHVTPVNGVASFGDSLKITPIGSATLHASTSGASVDSQSFQIVYDLKACNDQKCTNVASNGAKNVQKAVNTLTTTGDFFDGTNTNVVLTTSFFDPTPFQSNCGVSSFVGQGTEAKLEGTGIASTAPTTTMLLLIPKKSLIAFGVASRSADSFQVCLGADRLDGGTAPFIAKDANGALIPAVQDPVTGTFWGSAADCTAFTPDSTNPCAALKTKNVGQVQAYFTSIGDSDTAASIPNLMSSSDLAVIVREGFPWDLKGSLN
jgi:hypothetical protein